MASRSKDTSEVKRGIDEISCTLAFNLAAGAVDRLAVESTISTIVVGNFGRETEAKLVALLREWAKDGTVSGFRNHLLQSLPPKKRRELEAIKPVTDWAEAPPIGVDGYDIPELPLFIVPDRIAIGLRDVLGGTDCPILQTPAVEFPPHIYGIVDDILGKENANWRARTLEAAKMEMPPGPLTEVLNKMSRGASCKEAAFGLSDTDRTRFVLGLSASMPSHILDAFMKSYKPE